jgi:hypothetical protein
VILQPFPVAALEVTFPSPFSPPDRAAVLFGCGLFWLYAGRGVGLPIHRQAQPYSRDQNAPALRHVLKGFQELPGFQELQA